MSFIEVKVEHMDYEESRLVYEGKYPDVPEYPAADQKVMEASAEPDVVASRTHLDADC